MKIAIKTALFLSLFYAIVLMALSVIYRPKDVKVTNVTSSSATISWYTDVPMTGVVKYKEKDSFLPLFLGGIGSQKSYDDRDFADAQSVCVEKFNEKIEKTLDSEFTVSGEDFDCENIKVKKVGRYYVHHVTVKGLKENKDYYFRIGNKLWSWKGTTSAFKTYETPTSIKEPVPVFGRVVSSEGEYSNDSLIYAKFKNTKSETSIEYSSVTNNDGGWYLDGGNLRNTSGEIMVAVPSEDSFEMYGRYKSSKLSTPTSFVFGDFDGAYPDLKVNYNEKDNFIYKFVFGVGAVTADPDKCGDPEYQANIGYGNCAKALAHQNGGQLNQEVLSQMGLCSSGNTTQCAGNFSAITNQAITGASWGEAGHAAEVVTYDTVDEDGEPVTLLTGWNEQIVDLNTSSTPPAGSESSGNNYSSGSIYLTMPKDGVGDWSLDFAGVEIKGEEDVKKYLELTDSEYDSLVAECETGKDCIYNISVTRINIVTLIQNDDEVGSCIKDGRCQVEGLDLEIEKQIDIFSTQASQNATALSNLNSLMESLKSNVNVTEGVALDLPYRYQIASPTSDGSTGFSNQTGQWLHAFNEYATEEEKELFALQIGMSKEEIDKITNWNNFEFYYSGGVNRRMVLRDGDGDDYFTQDESIGNTGTGSKSIYVYLSEQTLLEINGNTEVGGLYSANEDRNSIIVEGSSINEALVSDVNKGSNSEKVEFAKSLGIDLPSNVNTNANVKIEMVDGEVVVSYSVIGNPKVVKSTLENIPTVLTLDEDSYKTIFPSSTSLSEPITIASTDSNVSFLASLNPANFSDVMNNNLIKNQGIHIGECVNKDCPSKTYAENVVSLLNSSRGSSDGVYIIVETVGEKGAKTYQIKYIETEAEINARMQYLENQINQLEQLQAPVSPGGFLRKMLLPKTYAAEKKTTSSEGFVFFLPEYGLFSLSLGDFEFEKDVSDGNTFYIFYLETNGKEGFQMPKDPDNPTIHEDVMIRSKSFEIQYEKKAEVRTYELKKGLNIVSFDFIPVGVSGTTYTANDIIANGKKNNTRIEYISYFDGGRWVDGYKCTEESCVGSNFTILPGRGYLVKAADKGHFSVSAYNLKSSIPLNLSSGWNLIGVHGYPKAYTAKTLIDSINKVEGLTADNVTWYPTSKGRYEGLQVSDGVEYGFDYPVSPSNGYFVRISEFEVEDEKCRSIIWHEGNALHGTCGDSKSLF